MATSGARVINSGNRQIIVIGTGDGEKYPQIVYVDSIAERDALDTSKLVFVRNAYLHDKSVTKGWAIYSLDKGVTPPVWRKIIEQESVDGPWGVAEEIKRSLVTKREFEVLKKLIERITPGGQLTLNWLDAEGIIKNRPDISAPVDEHGDAAGEWTADLDHVKVGDVKGMKLLGNGSSTNAILDKLNTLLSIFGADTSSDKLGLKKVRLFNGETELVDRGSFGDAAIGTSGGEPIVVVGNDSTSSEYSGLWWSDDGITFHKSNVNARVRCKPVYSERLGVWVASCDANTTPNQLDGVVYSSDGKTWQQSNLTGAQPDVALYDDGTYTLFMCGYSLSSNGSSWTAGACGSNANVVASSIGMAPQAALVRVRFETTGTRPYLYVVTPARCLINGVRHVLASTLVDVSTTMDSSITVVWDDVGNQQDFVVDESTVFAAISRIKFNTTRDLLFISAINKPLSYFIKMPRSTEYIEWDAAASALLPIPTGLPTDVNNGYGEATLINDRIVMPTMFDDVDGDSMYQIHKTLFSNAILSEQTPEWTHVTTAANGGTIFKGSFNTPSEIVAQVRPSDVTLYLATGYDYRTTMLFSLDAIDWYKSEYSINSTPPVIINNNVVFPMRDGNGIMYIPVREFVDSATFSRTQIKPDTVSKLAREWTEVEIVDKINELTAVCNHLLSFVGTTM